MFASNINILFIFKDLVVNYVCHLITDFQSNKKKSKNSRCPVIFPLLKVSKTCFYYKQNNDIYSYILIILGIVFNKLNYISQKFIRSLT